MDVTVQEAHDGRQEPQRGSAVSDELNNKERSARSGVPVPSETVIAVSANHVPNGNEEQKAPGPFSSPLGCLAPVRAD